MLKKLKAIDHAATGAEARRERDTAGLSLRTVALRMSVSHVALHMLERGAIRWTRARVAEFNDVLKNHHLC